MGRAVCVVVNVGSDRTCNQVTVGCLLEWIERRESRVGLRVSVRMRDTESCGRHKRRRESRCLGSAN